MSEKKLLLLDIKGVLCRTVDPEEDLVDLKLGRYNVIFRPGCREFLAKCYQHFTVGFMSSTTYKNAGPILEALLTKEQQKKTLLKWFRDRTSLDPNWELWNMEKLYPENEIWIVRSGEEESRRISSHQSWSDFPFAGIQIKQHSTVKRLSSVLESPSVNEKRIYSWRNILICDDSAEKLRFNPKLNCLIVPSFVGGDDTVLENLFDQIQHQFEIIGEQPDPDLNPSEY